MKTFFVDFENVKSAGLEGISKCDLKESDSIIIFYSKNANSITIDLLRELEKTKAKKEYIKVKVGAKNALDFQLATYLGSYIEKDDGKRIFIISGDLGFDAICDFWKSRNVIIRRIDSISAIDRSKEDIITSLSGLLTEKDASKVYNIICNYKTKQGIHNNLMKAFPSEEHKLASEIYKRIKSFINDKKDK